MSITTIENVENLCIKETLGIVVSATQGVLTPKESRALGSTKPDPEKLINLKKLLLSKMENQAKELGANGILGFRMEFEYQIVAMSLSIRMSGYGTAVKLSE